MAEKMKVDMRYNDVREAVIEISNAYKKVTLTDEALSILIANASKKISKSQVMEVLKQLPRLEKMYLKQTGL